jgi:myxalamid-type polyketide synthase MxaE and MxaD
LKRFLDRFAAEAWPRIRGVMHVAGVVEDQLLRDASLSSFEHVLRPKVDGALSLHRCIPELDHFVLFSSVVALFPQPGAASYAAANAYLDAFAMWRNAQGLPALSIEWAPWSGTGFAVARGGAANVANLARMGIGELTIEQGLDVLERLLGRRNGVLVGAPIDPRALATSPGARHLSIAEDVAFAQPVARDSSGATTAAAAPPSIESVVREAVGRVLKVAPARIDPRKPFGSMGLTSIMAVELRNTLERAAGRPLSATLAWNYPTVHALVAYLAGGDTGSTAKREPMRAPATAPAVEAVRDMADADAARLLRKKRSE